MFLEDKLQGIFERYQTLDSNQNRGFDFMNCMIEHVAERLKDSHSYHQCYMLVKQTDNIWRSFAKKNNLNPDFFRNNYIIRMCAKMPGANEYFKITKQEIEKYGQN